MISKLTPDVRRCFDGILEHVSSAPFASGEHRTPLLSDVLSDIREPRTFIFSRSAQLHPGDSFITYLGEGGSEEEILYSSYDDISSMFKSDNFDKYGGNYFYETRSGSIFGYSSCPDNINIMSVANELLNINDDVAMWDKVFYDEIINVGYGEVSRKYMRQLLKDFPEPRRTKFLAEMLTDEQVPWALDP